MKRFKIFSIVKYFTMNIYFSAANHESKDEYYYLFLKRLCQVLIELGKQLCALWVSNKNIDIKFSANNTFLE